VTSREGEGTTFTVLLPILEVPAALEKDSSGLVVAAQSGPDT